MKRTGKQRAAALILKWLPRLGLGEWDVRLSEHESADKDDAVCAFETMAEINADSVYSVAKLKIFPSFGTRSKEDQEETIVHELIHCHLSAMERLINSQRDGQMVTPQESDKENERLTQALTNALTQAYREK